MISCKAKVNEAVIACEDIYTVVSVDTRYVNLENYMGESLHLLNDFILVNGVKRASADAEASVVDIKYLAVGNL